MPKVRLGRSGDHGALFDLGQDVYNPFAEQRNLPTRGELLCRCGRWIHWPPRSSYWRDAVDCRGLSHEAGQWLSPTVARGARHGTVGAHKADGRLSLKAEAIEIAQTFGIRPITAVVPVKPLAPIKAGSGLSGQENFVGLARPVLDPLAAATEE